MPVALSGATAGVLTQTANLTLPYQPSDVPNMIGHWSMVDSVVTTAAGNVTVVSDLVGGLNLVGGTQLAPPEDVASDPGLGGRRACKHVTDEDVSATGFVDLGDSTLSIVLSLEAVTAGDVVFMLYNGIGDAIVCDIAAGPVWRLRDGTNTWTGGVPAIDTAYLLTFENAGAASRLLVNGVAVIAQGMIALNVDYLIVGYEWWFGASGGDLTWTEALLTSDIMAKSDQDGLLEWAQANCGV